MSSQNTTDKNDCTSLPKANQNARGPQKGRIHLSACKRGSFTLEAAVIYPLVAAFWVGILFFFRVMQVETEVQEALYYAGRMTAVESSCIENGTALYLSCEGLFRKELAGNQYAGKYVRGGTAGIHLASKEAGNDFVKLQAEYTVRLPIPFFSLGGISIIQDSCNRRWTGRPAASEEDAEDVYVYYTDYGTVYHMTDHCSYLDLKISSTSLSGIGAKRSKSGAIYYPCSLCHAVSLSGGTVYYTLYGNNYHTSVSCSGLKRTIHRVSLSAVAGMRACSRCGSQ